MIDLTLLLSLSNLHRFVRERRKPAPPAPAGRKMRPADRTFLVRTLAAAVVIAAAIGVLWSML